MKEMGTVPIKGDGTKRDNFESITGYSDGVTNKRLNSTTIVLVSQRTPEKRWLCL